MAWQSPLSPPMRVQSGRSDVDNGFSTMLIKLGVERSLEKKCKKAAEARRAAGAASAFLRPPSSSPCRGCDLPCHRPDTSIFVPGFDHSLLVFSKCRFKNQTTIHLNLSADSVRMFSVENPMQRREPRE